MKNKDGEDDRSFWGDEYWVFSFGIHKNSLTSRDVAPNMLFESREKAFEFYRKKKNSLESFGYKFWFAKVTSPDGVCEILEENDY